MAGGIMNTVAEKNYDEEEQQYLFKEAHTIAVELGYAGSWDQFEEDFSKMIADRNFKIRMGK